jgi:hypothetical protein
MSDVERLLIETWERELPRAQQFIDEQVQAIAEMTQQHCSPGGLGVSVVVWANGAAELSANLYDLIVSQRVRDYPRVVKPLPLVCLSYPLSEAETRAELAQAIAQRRRDRFTKGLAQ